MNATDLAAIQAVQKATIALLRAEAGSDDEERLALALAQIAVGGHLRARVMAVIVRTVQDEQCRGALVASELTRMRRAALDAADMFLTALCEGRVPPCFVPKNEHAALGINVGSMLLRAIAPRGMPVIWTAAQREKLVELRDLVKAACAELETTGKDVPS